MSNVSSTTASTDPSAAGVDATDGTLGLDPSAYLTPDALLAYCQSRLQSIDSQIQTGLETQQRNNTEIAGIGQVLADLNAVSSGSTSSDTIRTAEKSLNTYITDMQANDPNNPNLGKLIQTYNQMVWSGTGGTLNGHTDSDPDFIEPDQYPPDETYTQGDNNYSADEAQGYIATIKGIHDSMNSDSELTMIDVQSLMSQRETAVQLTTNMMQSLDDQAKQITQNIGH
jgi:hypothetical protein